jgi:hypothetical protein
LWCFALDVSLVFMTGDRVAIDRHNRPEWPNDPTLDESTY